MTLALIMVLAACVGVTLVAERREAAWRVWPKAAASTAFIGIALSSGAADSAYGRWVLAALALGWAGDVSLAIGRRLWFMVGLIAFLLSHLAYVGGFLAIDLRGIAAAVGIVVLAVPAVLVGRWLLPHVGRDLRVPVIAYIVVITVMVAAATGAACDGAPWPVLPAAGLFYLSDLLVARERFVTPGFANRMIGLPLYYAAQVLFALSTGMVS
jgi:uncharacterized membrane protein YhhN